MNSKTAKMLRKVAVTEASRNPRWRKSYRRLKALWQTLPHLQREAQRAVGVAIVAKAGGVA